MNEADIIFLTEESFLFALFPITRLLPSNFSSKLVRSAGSHWPSESIKEIIIDENWNFRTEYTFKRKGKEIPKQVFWFLAETDELEVKLSHEHTNYLWLNFEDCEKQLTFSQEKILLQSACDYRKKIKKQICCPFLYIYLYICGDYQAGAAGCGARAARAARWGLAALVQMYICLYI